MAEWIGNYDLHYEWYNDHRDKWVKWKMPLGRCLSKDEAIDKAIDYFLHETRAKCRNAYIEDGWGNKIKM